MTIDVNRPGGEAYGMGLGRKREDDPNIPTYIRKWHGAILSAGLGWVVAGFAALFRGINRMHGKANE